MFIIARPDRLSVVILLLKYVFRRFKVLNDLSHSAEVTGNVQRMRSRTFTLGKKKGWHSLSVAETLFGRLDLSATSDHLRRLTMTTVESLKF